MTSTERQNLLNANYSECDIIELCWIHAKCLKEEEYEICAKIVEGLKNRALDDMDKLTLKRHLLFKETTYPYLNEINGLIDNLDLTI